MVRNKKYLNIKNKDSANSRLRWAIKILKGEAYLARSKVILSHVLEEKDSLEASGWWWQAERLDNFIHKFQRGDFTRLESHESRDPSWVKGRDSQRIVITGNTNIAQFLTGDRLDVEGWVF